MNILIKNVDFWVEPEDINCLNLEVADLVAHKEDLSSIIVDNSIFDDFRKYSLIDIIWVDKDEEKIYTYTMVGTDADDNILMELYEIKTIEAAINAIKQDLENEYIDTYLHSEDDEDPADVLSRESGWLVNSLSYEIILS